MFACFPQDASTFQRMSAKTRNYRDYRNFDNDSIREYLLNDLAKENISDSDLNIIY